MSLSVLLFFLSRDAVLVRYMPLPCVSVCTYVTSRSSIETAEQVGAGFGVGASFDLSYSAS